MGHSTKVPMKRSSLPWGKKTELVGDITVVFATNNTGFNLGPDPFMELDSKGEPCTISRQHLDNEGKVVEKDENAMNSIICEYLDHLVDKNVVKVRFLVCSH
jgi:hypothetical protein